MHRGRTISAKVDAYLKAVGKPKPRGRKVSREDLEARLASAKAEAASTEGVAKLKATQEAKDLTKRIADLDGSDDAELEELTEAFVEVAAEYSESQGITYGTWRDNGVPADVLKRAGVKRTRSS